MYCDTLISDFNFNSLASEESVARGIEGGGERGEWAGGSLTLLLP